MCNICVLSEIFKDKSFPFYFNYLLAVARHFALRIHRYQTCNKELKETRNAIRYVNVREKRPMDLILFFYYNFRHIRKQKTKDVEHLSCFKYDDTKLTKGYSSKKRWNLNGDVPQRLLYTYQPNQRTTNKISEIKYIHLNRAKENNSI